MTSFPNCTGLVLQVGLVISCKLVNWILGKIVERLCCKCSSSIGINVHTTTSNNQIHKMDIVIVNGKRKSMYIGQNVQKSQIVVYDKKSDEGSN